MARNENTEISSSAAKGNRIVQIILLVLIALGIVGIPLILKGGESAGAGMGPGAGGPPGAPGGVPGGFMEDSQETESVIRVTGVGVGSVREYVRVNGDVDAKSSVNIYPDTSGKLISVSVSPGDSVRRGQTVAVVDPSLPGQVYGPSAVIATINGTVTAVNIDVGETVSTSSAVVTVGDLSALQIITYVPERYVGSVALGMDAEVILDAYPDEIFPARVTEISPVLDLKSRSQEISLDFLNVDSRVKAGMFVSTRIVVEEAVDVVTVPPAALTTYYGQDVVYVVNGETVERREVTVGLSSSNAVQISEGLSLGETVAVQGLSGITDGSRVRIVD